MSSANTALLNVEGLNKRFGGITTLTDYSVEIRQGELVGLIGPNGAGKTSMLRTISGLLRPESGRILYKPHDDGEEIDISRVSAERIVALGISHCPEGRGIFSRLSVRENLMVGAYLRKNKQAIEQDYSRICVVAFIAAYEKEYGRPPENAFAALGFDAVGLIADAIQRAGATDGKAPRAALAGTQGFKAVTGEITYSRPSGVPMKGVSIISVHDGKYKVEEVWFPKQ